MSQLPDRVRRAFADHDGFEADARGEYVATSTAFDARVAVDGVEEGHVTLAVEMCVPTLSAVVDGDVAAVVEEGWYETFELRVSDADGVTRANHDLDPAVDRTSEEVIVSIAYTDTDEGRAVDDAAALVTFVEGTFVQGVIPGYDYTDPVSSILSTAQDRGGF